MTKKQISMVTLSLLLANIMSGLDATIINTAIPAIVSDLHGIQYMGWIVACFLLGMSVSVPIWSKIGERMGNKFAFELSLALFILGSVLPDLTKDKSKTHYGKSPAYTNFKKFLLFNDLSTELNKGEFVHLITDYLFYNHYLEFFSKKDIYNDYDISNKSIIEKYNVKLLDEIKDTVFLKEGEMKVLNLPLIYKLIDEISDIDLETVKKEES